MTHRRPITVEYQGSQLLAVPAIHNSHEFATEVNRICRDMRFRPDAVAVELGPQTAAAMAVWLRELGAGPNRRHELPIMLGLMKPNRMIRASLKEKAWALQRSTGRDLSEMSPDVLREELGYVGWGLMLISPADSIVEAIRCSLELNVPLYGVDLEEMADRIEPAISKVIQDPLAAGEDFSAYVAQNAPYTAKDGDGEIDPRREMVMAARLKTLLLKKKHNRVLFTCGLGHWVSIVSMLENPSVRPAGLNLDCAGDNCKRVVVEPSIAVNHMAPFPALIAAYERARQPAWRPRVYQERNTPPDCHVLFENLLKKAYTRYFCSKEKESDQSKRLEDLKSIDHFETYLRGLCLAHLMEVPDMFSAFQAARETMSKDFAGVLINQFMDFPWALPVNHPGLPLLIPKTAGSGDTACMFFDWSEVDPTHFYVRMIPSLTPQFKRRPIPLELNKEKNQSSGAEGSGFLHTWGPWDRLITSMAMRGISSIKRNNLEKQPMKFEGAVLEGIAVKETIRAWARGEEDRLYVNGSVTKKSGFANNPFTGAGFPVVFILTPGDHPDADWSALFVYVSWMEKYVRDRARLLNVLKTKGNKMVSLIVYGEEDSGISNESSRVYTDRYHGVLLFQPENFDNRQFAIWAEMSRYIRNPFCNSNLLMEDSNYSDFTRQLEEVHGIRLGAHRWDTTLMLMAIPFAQGAVSVIAPAGYEIDPVVFQKGKRYGVQVCRSPLEAFSKEEIDRLSIGHLAPAMRNDPQTVYDTSVEEAIGEKQTDFQDLVPKVCDDFGKCKAIIQE